MQIGNANHITPGQPLHCRGQQLCSLKKTSGRESSCRVQQKIYFDGGTEGIGHVDGCRTYTNSCIVTRVSCKGTLKKREAAWKLHFFRYSMMTYKEKISHELLIAGL